MKARAIAYKAKIRIIVRKLILDHLQMNPCVDCGERDPIVLEFDHRGEKKFNISAAYTVGYSVAAVSAEIAKCDVRCANCHRRKTYKERGFSHRDMPA